MNALVPLRPLSKAERFYWLMDRAVSTNFVVSARLPEAPEPARLREVLGLVGLRHPMLHRRVLVNGVGKVVLDAAPEGPAFVVERAEETGWDRVCEELDRPFTAGGWPLARVLLQPEAGSCWMHLVVNHGISDARSVSLLLLEILGLLGGAEVEAQRPLLPAQEALYPARYLGLRARLRWGWLVLRDGLAVLALGKVRHLPGLRLDAWTPRRCVSRAFSMDADRTAALAARARAEGCSVQSALCAAQLLALRREFPEPGLLPMVVGSAVDMRPFLGPAGASRVEPQDLGMYASFAATGHQVSDNPAFWDLAREHRARLQARIREGHPALVWSAFLPDWMFPPDSRGALGLLRGVLAAPPSSFVTNLGRLPEGRSAGIEVRFTMAPQVGSPLCTAAVADDGGLRVQNTFNAAVLDAERVERVASAFAERLEGAIA